MEYFELLNIPSGGWRVYKNKTPAFYSVCVSNTSYDTVMSEEGVWRQLYVIRFFAEYLSTIVGISDGLWNDEPKLLWQMSYGK